MKALFSALALSAAISTSAIAAPNLVVNGGFENVTTSETTGFEINYAGTVDNWNSAVSGSNTSGVAFNLLFPSATAASLSPNTRYVAGERQYLAVENYGGASPNGGNFIALDGDSNYNGYLYQNISGLTVGQTYKLTFSWAATQFDNRVGETTERVAFNLGDTYNFDPLTSQTTATVGGPTHYWNGWNTVTATFKATSTDQVLSFLSIGTPAGLPPVALLDGVSLNAVPEPASWALLLFGFGSLGMAARRRRQVINVTA
jgi:hypothetical protein